MRLAPMFSARTALAAAVLALSALAAPAAAQSDLARDGWDTIGRKSVNAGIDNDHVRVSGNVRYRKVRLCAVNRPIELRHMNVRFHNGDSQNFPANRLVAAGSCTHGFDLRGKRRNMDHIYLTYARVFPGGEPDVIIQAR